MYRICYSHDRWLSNRRKQHRNLLLYVESLVKLCWRIPARYMVVTGPLRKCYSHCWSALNLSPGNAPSALWSSCPPELLWSSRHCDWGVLITIEKVTLFYKNSSFLFIVPAKHMKWTRNAKVMFAHLSVSFISHTLHWLWWCLYEVTTCDTGIRYSFFFGEIKNGFWDHHYVSQSFHFNFWTLHQISWNLVQTLLGRCLKVPCPNFLAFIVTWWMFKLVRWVL